MPADCLRVDQGGLAPKSMRRRIKLLLSDAR